MGKRKAAAKQGDEKVADITYQAPGSKPCLIDVHHHTFPPPYMAVLNNLGISTSGSFNIPEWSPQIALSMMDRNGIATAIVSITSPGVYFKNNTFSRDLARRCNEYHARLVEDYPGRFGAYAALPLPDVEGALKELEYSLDKLKLDGVGLLTNVQGHYLGDPEFNELFEELNRRKMVVFIHPHDPPFGYITKLKVPIALTEYPLETTRTVGNLIYGGTLENYPNIRFILPHAGGALPYLTLRYSLLYAEGINKDRDPRDAIKLLQRQFYETAMSATPYALRSLQELVGPSQILFGSDGGMAPTNIIPMLVKGLHEYDGFDKKALALIERENALELFPRFKG